MEKIGFKIKFSVIIIISMILIGLSYIRTFATATGSTIASGLCGDNANWVLDSDGTLTISGSGNMDGSSPWNNEESDYTENIYTVIIEPGITNVGSFAFWNCKKLEKIVISNTVKVIEDTAFGSCSNLETITIPNGVEQIDSYAFSDCENLKKVNISSSVNNISTSAFSGCSNLSDFIVDSNNATFSSQDGILFNKDRTLLIKCAEGKAGKYVIPENVTNIGNGAFINCKKLTEITMSDSISNIESNAFSGSGIESINISNNVTIIREHTFDECRKMKSITLPNSITSIADYAFLLCTSLKSVKFSNKTSDIGNCAFFRCSELKSVTIPKSVKNIGVNALGVKFDSSGDLEKVEGFTICGYKNSIAEKYAIENDFKFVALTATPKLTSISNTSKGVTIKWEKVTDAVKYRVYRKSESDGWKKVVDTTSAKYEDTSVKSGVTYSYTVRSISNDGKFYASGYDKKGKSIKYLAKPKLSSATNASSGITIKWEKVSGTSGYYIYRKTGSEKYSKIAIIEKNSTTSYKDTTVKSNNGTKYTYTVRAYSGKTLSSYESGKTIIRLISPSISSLKNSKSKSFTLKWKKNTKASGYQIQYSTNNKFSNGTKTKKISDASTVSATISKLAKGTTYYIRIRAYKTVSDKTYYSGWSSVKNIKISK